MASSSNSTSFPHSSPDPSSSSVVNKKKRKRESCAYEVFLSFRGEDTRKSFVDHLYAALDRCGIYTFKDDKRLRGGESISRKLLEAIEQSVSAIVVFSKNYASSSWCLDELVKIMDQSKEENLAVYPLFYDVDPFEVRRQTGIFGQGFAKAAERKADRADAWRKALQDASNLSGYDLRNTADGRESQCIEKVVEWCSNHSCNTSAIDEDLIGMPSRVKNLILLLRRRREDLDDIRMIGIWGMGGVGKTTLADATFHEVKNQFDGASFIADIREKSKTIVGLQLLQKQIMSDILMDKNLEVNSVVEGKKMLKRRLSHRKVLIVLDDVDNDEQLHALAGDDKWFGKGSRVLITTRDRHVLEVHEIDKKDIHTVDLLSEDDAIRLFNRHAFKKKCNSTKEYNELSLRVVRYATGLPLALKVLGSFLCGRGMVEWNSALKRLENNSEGKILEKLQISYDGLNQVEKEIFLDIACLFKGWKKDKVIRILDCCELDPVIGIDVLLQKSLISVSYEKVQMHDLLQEMGRNIGRQSRLWGYEDVNDVLRNNTGTEAIEAIVIKNDFLEEQTFDSKAFMSMKKLRLLHLCKYSCTSFVGPEYLPNELRWLSWQSYPHASLPESFQARKLVALEMINSSIVQLWEGTKLLDKLKILNLSHSTDLIRTPDFSGIPNLVTLILWGCSSLIEVHQSIGDLKWLVSLELGQCRNLVDFPSNIQMKSLEYLSFFYCEEFKRFPEIGENMDRLSELRLEYTGIEDLPSSIANLTKLVSIHLTNCKKLLHLPDTICTLKNLKEMVLRGCRNLRKLPENLSHIESLEVLDVSNSGVKVLPSSNGHLKQLSLSGCRELILEDSMAHIGSCLKVLDLSQCELSYHQAIHIDIGKLSFLEDLNLNGNPFASVPINISQLPRLKILDLSDCKELKALPELPSSIAILKANGCTSLECIKSLSAGTHEWLWSVSLLKCGSDVVKQLPNLRQSMYQGNAVVNHELHIRYTEHRAYNAIQLASMWLGHEDFLSVWKRELVFKLHPNWQKRNDGLALFLINDRDGWIGYISLKMLQRLIESSDVPTGWMDAVTQLHLQFPMFEWYAGRVVCMEASSMSALSSDFTSSSSSLQHKHDPSTTLQCFQSTDDQIYFHDTADQIHLMLYPCSKEFDEGFL